MVLDPFSAISVASNIVQFVQFGAALVSKSYEIYRSSDGTSVETGDIEEVGGNLNTLSKGFLEFLNNSVDPQECGLRQMALGCKNIGEELLEAISHIKRGKDDKRHKKWRSFRQALSSIMKEDKIAALQKRLDLYRGQLALQLTAFVSNKQLAMLDLLRTAILRDRDCTQDLLTMQRHETLLKQMFCAVERTASQMDTVQKWDQSLASKQDLQDCSKALTEIMRGGYKFEKQYRFLNTLNYPSMRSRHDRIAEAHAKTFDWIFVSPDEIPKDRKLPAVKFFQWLRQSECRYWISGKAGSGKSTLMKYLSNHPNTRLELEHWAKESKLVIASFYFWNAGTDMERTQIGLLQSLLHQILREEPDLIPIACPQRWKAVDGNYPSPWTIPELVQSLKSLLVRASTTKKFCFFIDGIDEYEGDLFDIVDALNVLANFPNVKLCLSSRPWNIFEDEYGENKDWKLYLQDLTKNDIELYVRNKLEENYIFRALAAEDSRCYEIVQETVERAQGVFLWVYLVVRSLREGLTNRDDFDTLQSRLRQLPTDLERFLKLILDSVDSVYHERSACTFIIALEANAPLSMLTMSYLDKDSEDYALELQPGASYYGHEQMAVSIYEKMRRRLNARCKGLLEITLDGYGSPYDRFSIDYLHRTVRDFLRKDEIQQYLKLHAKGFDPSKIFGRSQLATIKTTKWSIQSLTRFGTFQSELRKAMLFAKQTETLTGITDHQMLDELWRTVDYFSYRNQCSILWYDSGPTPVIPCDTFPNFALQSDLSLYIEYLTKHKSTSCISSSLTTQPLLYTALLRPTTTSSTTAIVAGDGSVPNTIIHTLLNANASPNQLYNGSSPFGHYLFSISIPNTHSFNASTHRRRHHIIRLLLEHGADPNQKFYNTSLWNRYLQFCRDNPGSNELNHLRLETIHLMLDFGADRETYLKYSDTWTRFLYTDHRELSTVNSPLLDSKYTAIMTGYGTIAVPQIEREQEADAQPQKQQKQQKRSCCGSAWAWAQLSDDDARRNRIGGIPIKAKDDEEVTSDRLISLWKRFVNKIFYSTTRTESRTESTNGSVDQFSRSIED